MFGAVRLLAGLYTFCLPFCPFQHAGMSASLLELKKLYLSCTFICLSVRLSTACANHLPISARFGACLFVYLPSYRICMCSSEYSPLCLHLALSACLSLCLMHISMLVCSPVCFTSVWPSVHTRVRLFCIKIFSLLSERKRMCFTISFLFFRFFSLQIFRFASL